MIKRTSLVWKRPGLSDAEFKSLWLGDHATEARELKGLREYVVDFIPDASPELPSGIAVVRFDDMAALSAAFSDTCLHARLLASRETFAARVEVFIVDENIVFPKRG
jgi:hypothetical protein